MIGALRVKYCSFHSFSGKKIGVLENQAEYGTDVNGVRYMIIYGIKGMAAYAAHAIALGEQDPWVSKFIYQVSDTQMNSFFV